MLNYYQNEYRLLNESAKEFAAEFPEHARYLHLEESGARDPHVEHLLQATAYLNSKIRQSIDAGLPRLPETFIHSICPQFLRPFPSTTIIEFSPRLQQLQQKYRMEEGLALLSQPVGEEETNCCFKTIADVEILPMSISNTRFTPMGSAQGNFQFDLDLPENLMFNDIDFSELRLYIHAEPSLALNLYYCLTRCISTIEISNVSEERIILGKQECLRPSFLSPEVTLLPENNKTFCPSYLLHEYFSFREKFLFITLHGFKTIDWPNACHKITVNIALQGSLPELTAVPNDCLRLHCVPAMNLYETEAEPITLDHTQSAYRMIPDTKKRDSLILTECLDVTGISLSKGERFHYHSFNAFPVSKEAGVLPQYFHSREDNGSAFPNDHINFSGLSTQESQRISCKIRVCNGFYPQRYIAAQTLTPQASDLPDSIAATNLTRPSQCLLPPNTENYQRVLMATLFQNVVGITDAQQLQAHLSLYQWNNREDITAKIKALSAFEIKPTQCMQKGIFYRVYEIHIVIQEKAFCCEGDMYLFGDVLHQFFTLHLSVNYLSHLIIQCQPSQREYEWKTTPS